MKMMWYTYTIEYHSVIRKNGSYDLQHNRQNFEDTAEWNEMETERKK